MKSKKVSVIVPCHNAEKWIAKTLDSILNQTHDNLEIIVVNDGSTDRSGEILESYRSKGVSVLAHPDNKNCGVSETLNLGISRSTSEYIAFLDADDLWHPDKVRVQLKYLEDESECDLVYVNGWAIDENDNKLYDLFPPVHEELNRPEMLLLDCYIRTPGQVMVRKKALDSVGGYDKSLSASDHDLWLRVIEQHKIAYLPQQLMYYRRHPGQVSSRRRQWVDGQLILEKAASRYPYSKSTIRKRRAVLQYRLAAHDFKDGQFFTGIFRVFHSFILDTPRAIRVVFSALAGKTMV